MVFVHQRVGRFIKDYLGLASVEEVTPPRGSDADSWLTK
jgi:hypothetical protein